MKLHSLAPVPGSIKERKRVGRGKGAGTGGTSTKGHKGHQSRSGHKFKAAFEGGQMPLQRRTPKFGFKNPFRVENQILDFESLNDIVKKHSGVSEITPEFLKKIGAIASLKRPVKILNNGKLDRALTIKAHKFSESAKAAIEQAGGQAIIIS